jgi:uncharacterized protein (DUF2235 family)
MTDSAASSAPPRQIVLLCDGTNNNLTGKHQDTNVVKLLELLTACPDPERVVFYDPGVGNPGALPGATTWTQFKRWLDRVNGLALGQGIYENIAETYLFLMRHYRPGDQIYILGFSRGAFTARCVGGLINQFGVLQPHMESMVHTLLHWYFAERTDKARFDAITDQIARQFSVPASRQSDIEFVGVWDTVASVGLPPFNAKFTASSDLRGKRFLHTRQALALDEHRAQFSPRLYAPDNGPIRTASGRQGSLQQLWFSGAHCDVGGGYVDDDAGLSDVAFAWLVSEAVQCGLRLSADGQPLDTEARVAAQLAASPHYPHAAHRTPRVNSELRSTALWAMTGMRVRDAHWVPAGNALTVLLRTDPAPRPTRPGFIHVRAENHPSVLAQAHQPSAWNRARTPWQVWATLMAALLIVVVQGLLLQRMAFQEIAWSEILSTARTSLAGPYLQLQAWFLWWPEMGPWGFDASAQKAWFDAFRAGSEGLFPWPRTTLLLDLAQVACHAVVLSWFAARAFARLAGLRLAGDPPTPWLNRLGWALPLAIFPDVLENLLLWLAWALAAQDLPRLGWIAHGLTGVMALLKFVGLAGVMVLVVWGTAAPRGRRQAMQAAPAVGQAP